MKVKCIDNLVERGRLPITIGKIYSVVDEIDSFYTIINDNGEEWCYLKYRFEEVEEVEKEKVLEVEFQDVFDKVAWRIAYQNTSILKRDVFRDKEIGVVSRFSPCFDGEILFIQGINDWKDNEMNIASKEEAEIIKQRVDAINDKYGIPKRWRAKEGDEYWYIHMSSGLNCFTDREGEHIPLATDHFRHKNRYNCGNYFRTRDEALNKLKEIEKILKGE